MKDKVCVCVCVCVKATANKNIAFINSPAPLLDPKFNLNPYSMFPAFFSTLVYAFN